jgi:drug/metabolite transporter (DMT)-like permease
VQETVIFSLIGAVLLSLNALTGKVLLRYRICNAGLVTWGTSAATAAVSLVVLAVSRYPFPAAGWAPLFGLSAVLLSAYYVTNRAMQEGDASTVAPLLGMKVPLTALLSFLILGETHPRGVYLAVLLAACAIACFGLGRPRTAQGSHGHRPIVAVVLACSAALLLATADQLAKLGLAYATAPALVVWSNLMGGVVGAGLLARPHYRQYRIKWLDVGLFVLRGVLLVGAISALYSAYRAADGVTIPNVLLATRGLVVLGAGYLLGKLLKTPMESQPGRVYVLRVLGALLIVASVALVFID